jgi:hypothetical protein
MIQDPFSLTLYWWTSLDDSIGVTASILAEKGGQYIVYGLESFYSHWIIHDA